MNCSKQTGAVDQWAVQNGRRIELIHKSGASGLTPQEQVELQALQAEMDRRLEPIDDLLLARVRQWESAAGLSSNGK